jgi:hypothetical protein
VKGDTSAGQGEADNAAQRMTQHDDARTGRDEVGDSLGEALEGIRG